MRITRQKWLAGAAGTVAILLAAPAAALAGGSSAPFVAPFHTVSLVGSTVPANGDVNPYGVVVVRTTTGRLTAGDILVSNFNDRANLQGTGTTIVELSPAGVLRQFAHLSASNLPGRCPGGVGLTTALAVLPGGWVVVGSLPTRDGSAATAKAGCLIVLDRTGKPVETIAGGPIDGPWDMTAVATTGGADLFVANVLNGTVAAGGGVVHRGTVVRVALRLAGAEPPAVTSERVVVNGLPERTDPNALVIGPTGVAVGGSGTLYVADTLGNRIAAVPGALTRQSAANGGVSVAVGGALNGPLGLVLAPGGDLVTVNGGDGNLVEVSPRGAQVAKRLLEPAGAGTLFGLAIAPHGSGVYFVDDGDNTLKLLH